MADDTTGASMDGTARQLSDLEHLVLGIVWNDGPLTPHAIRTHPVMARNSRFSGSTGSIYPLVRRLERDGLLQARECSRGRQELVVYESTRAGRMTLRSWVGSPWPESGPGVLQDPIRLRMFFMGSVTALTRRTFLDKTEERLKEQELELRADWIWNAGRNEEWRVFCSLGALAVCRAQRRWIQEIQAAFEDWP